MSSSSVGTVVSIVEVDAGSNGALAGRWLFADAFAGTPTGERMAHHDLVQECGRRQLGGRVFVAVAEAGKVVGHAVLETNAPLGWWRQWGAADGVEVGSVCVRDGWRREGVAGRLVAACVAAADDEVPVVAATFTGSCSERLFAGWDRLGSAANWLGDEVSVWRLR